MCATLSDFWWLDNNQLDRFSFLEFGYHEPVDNSQTPSIQPQKCQIADIDRYRSKYQNINVHRSLKLADNPSNGEVIIGPFLIDIDNDDSLEAAQEITKQTIQYLTKQNYLSPMKDFRIFFTGHKGFNIEIRPMVLNISGQIPDQIRLSNNIQVNIINHLRNIHYVQCETINAVDDFGTIIDSTYGSRYFPELKHPYTRLHNSINSWVGDNGKITSRKKIELSYQDLLNKSIEDIIAVSEV